MIEYEWDPKKNESNLAKHGISFELAVEIFDGIVLTKVDTRKDYGEIREVSIGVVDASELFVVHTQRSQKKRIISARRANRAERKVYYEYLKRRTAEETSGDG